MSSVYTPSAVVLGNITVPSDGDARSAASVNAPIEAVADGLVYERAARIAADAAIVAIVATLAALKAVAAPTNGLLKFVRGYGVYTFDTAATESALSPWVLAADDATPGKWIAGAPHDTTVSVRVPCCIVKGVTASAGALADLLPDAYTDFGPIGISHAYLNSNGFYPLVIFTGATNHYGFYVPLDDFLMPYENAYLVSATLRLRPNSGHGALPTRQPKLGIFRSYHTGLATTPEALLSTGSGFVQLAAASVVAYEADQSLVYTANQNNQIYRGAWNYGAYIFDEAGTNAIAGNRYACIDLVIGTILNPGP